MQFAAGCLQQFVGVEAVCSIVMSYVPTVGFAWATTLEPSEHPVLTMTPFGTDMIAAGLVTGEIRVCNTVSGRCIFELLGHAKAVASLVDCGGGILASAADDGVVMVWNCATRKCIFTERSASTTKIKFSTFPNGDLAFAATDSIGLLPSITVLSREHFFQHAACKFTLWCNPGAMVTLQETLVIASNRTMVKFSKNGKHLTTVSLGEHDLWKRNSQVALVALPNAQLASLVDGYVDIWQSQGENLFLLRGFDLVGPAPLMTLCHGCLVIVLNTRSRLCTSLQVCTATHKRLNRTQIPAWLCNEIVVLPDNRIATLHIQTETIHVWSMCLQEHTAGGFAEL